MSASSAGGERASKPRVGLLFLRAGRAGFTTDEGSPVPRIARRRWLPAPAVTTSILSGAALESHHVQTWLVPSDGDSNDISAGAAEGLRSRRSTEVGRPLVWNRLAEHDVHSIVVGSPFMPGGRTGVEELTAHTGFGVVRPSSTSSNEEKFAMLEASKRRRPDAGFAFLSINAAGETDAQEGMASEPTTRRAVEELVDRFTTLMELDHVLLVSSSSIFEWVSYRGSREVQAPKRLRTGVVIQTIFDLFDLPHLTDVPAASMLQIETGEEDSAREPEIRWMLPDEDDVELPDFEPLLDRIRGGEAGPITRRVGSTIFECRWEQAFERGSTVELDEASRDLLLAADGPLVHVRRLISMAATRDAGSFAEARALLHERHPGTMADRLADLLPLSAVTDEARLEILDENPIKEVQGTLLRGLWGRSAIRLDRTDEGLKVLWGRISRDTADRRETLTFAQEAIKRNQEGDLKRARFALRRQLETTQGPERRSKLVRRIAHTFELEGDVAMAIGCLEGFLDRNPEEMGATRMLDRLRRLMTD